MNNRVDIITRDEKGYTFGSGQLEGWAFDATCKPQDRERTVRNALLSFLRAQVDGNEERAKAILNLPLPGGSKVYEIMGAELARYAGADEEVIPVTTEEVVPVSVEKEIRRASRTKRFLTRPEVMEKIEGFTKLQKHRPRLVEHHQNDHKAFAWIWKEAFLAVEVHEEGRAERLTYLPDWAKRNGNPTPEYVEHDAEPHMPEPEESRLPDVAPSPAVTDLYKDCVSPDQLESDLNQREKGEPLKPSRTYAVVDNHGPLPGEAWLTRTLTETVSVSTARRGRTGNRPACELCLRPIDPGASFTKGSTGARKAHTSCFEKRASARAAC